LNEADYRSTLGELTELLDVKDLMGVQVRRLSLGERMKMELIASLLHRPEVMFLDEPTIGLDIISQKRIREFLRSYNREKQTTVLLTSHSISDIEDLCRRTIVVADGKIAYDGELKKINGLFGERKRIQVTFENEEASKIDLSRYGILCSRENMQAVIEVDRDQVREVSRAMLETLPVTDFNIGDIPVEEGIARLYTGGNGQ
jgi:ABC-2 type transport system ATP-binding protein